MVTLVSGTLIDRGIYHRDRNEKTRPMMVLEVDEVAESGWAATTPVNETMRLGFPHREQWPPGRWGK